MISYKEFKQLNENFGFNLGLKTTQSLGLVGAHTAGEAMTFEQMLEEAKKKAKKKMLAGAGNPPLAKPDEEDGEMVDPSAVKDDPDADDDDDDVTDDDDEDDDDDQDDDGDDDMADLKDRKFSKKKMSADGKCSKCGHSPCTCGGSKLHNHSLKNTDKKDKSGAHLEDPKKNVIKTKYKEAMMEEMEKEFFSSLKSMMAPPKARDFKSVSEEMLINPNDPNYGLVANDSEPFAVTTPGSVGFAPDTILGHPTGGLGSKEGQGFGGFGGMYESVDPIKKK